MKIQYVAYDGTIFDNRDACELYESAVPEGVILYCGSLDYALNDTNFNIRNYTKISVKTYVDLDRWYTDALVIIIPNHEAYERFVKYCNDNMYDVTGITDFGIYYYNSFTTQWEVIETIEQQVNTARESLTRLHYEFIGREY